MGRRKPITKPKKRKQLNLGGRPSGFKDEMIAQVADLVGKHDYTDAQIAAFFDVNPSTLWRWKMAVPKFAKAFERGEDQQVRTLEASMFARGTGFSQPAVRIFPPRTRVVRRVVNGKTRRVTVTDEPVIVKYEEHFPPDPTAAFRLLKKLRPNEYNDKLIHAGDANEPVTFQMINRPPKEEAHDGRPRQPARPAR